VRVASLRPFAWRAHPGLCCEYRDVPRSAACLPGVRAVPAHPSAARNGAVCPNSQRRCEVSHCQARGVGLYCLRRGCAYGAVEFEEEIATPDATSNCGNTIVAPPSEIERINLRRAVGLEAQIIAQGIPPWLH
jgi:hypothetical protein